MLAIRLLKPSSIKKGLVIKKLLVPEKIYQYQRERLKTQKNKIIRKCTGPMIII